MQKIISLFLIFTTAFLLAGCGEPETGDLPPEDEGRGNTPDIQTGDERRGPSPDESTERGGSTPDVTVSSVPELDLPAPALEPSVSLQFGVKYVCDGGAKSYIINDPGKVDPGKCEIDALHTPRVDDWNFVNRSSCQNQMGALISTHNCSPE